MSRLVLIAFCLLVAATASPVARADLFTVDTLLDGPPDHDANLNDGACVSQRGSCSLRAAIEQANALAGPHVIRFSVAGTIALSTEGRLPSLQRRIDLRGDTAPGYATSATDIGAAPPRIQLDGSFAPAGAVGLRLLAGSSGSLIRALSIVSMPASAIDVTAPAADVIIRDCWLGIASDASVAGNDIGVYVSGSGTRIGRYLDGNTPVGLGNVVSGNRVGVLVASSASNVSLHGNRIGLRANGLSAAPNSGHGVEIEGGSAHRVGGILAGQAVGNLIASNGLDGILIRGGSGHEVKSNQLGVNRNGVALASSRIGIAISGATTDANVGGSEMGEGNSIANYGDDGIQVGSTFQTDMPVRITLEGNTIGSYVTATGVGDDGIRINACDQCLVVANTILRAEGDGLVLRGNGTRAYGNHIGFIQTIFDLEPHGVGGAGIAVYGNNNVLEPQVVSEDGSSANVVGFSGGHGVRIDGNGNLLQGALVGVIGTGEPMPNAGDGVNLGPNASDNRVQFNAITHNAGGGIVLAANTADALGNRFRRNLLAMNDGLEIDLGDDGLDINDTGDLDEGPHRRINTPVLSDAQWLVLDGVPHVRVSVSHDAQAGALDYPIFFDVFLNTEPVREASRYLGAEALLAPGEVRTLEIRLPAGTRGGYLTAVAGTAAAGSSELSAPLPFGQPQGLFFDGFEGLP